MESHGDEAGESISGGMAYDLCCIGHMTIDRVVTPHHTTLMPGGTSFYFSSALAGLDIRYLLVTMLGANDRNAVEALLEKGVLVNCYFSEHTHFFENIYGDDPDQRTQRVLQQSASFSPEQLAGLPKASVYHLGSLLAGDFSLEAIKTVAAKGRLSLDVQGFLRRVENKKVVPVDWTAKKAVLPFIHFLKANEEELEVITGCADVATGAGLLLQWGASEVIITQGSKGSVIFTRDNTYKVPAFAPNRLTDATGCGDTYMAGYLFKRSKGAGIGEAGEFAAAMATLKLQQSGPFTGLEEEVDAIACQQR